MTRYLLSAILLLCISTAAMTQNSVSHEKWTALLEKYVNPYGKVDYKGFKADEAALDEYLDVLRAKHPQPYWKVTEQQAYWINAYNAFTIKLILQHYPVKSIRDIMENEQDAWHIPFIVIEGKSYTLDYIEHTMLLDQFNDSRIHFVINCAAKSCPALMNKAYSGDNLLIELRLAAKRFVNDNRFNIISNNHLQLSQIFNWYSADFIEEEGSLQKYINVYSPHVSVSSEASVNFLKYNWNLNEQ